MMEAYVCPPGSGSPWPGEMLVAPFPHPTFSGRPSGPTGCGASPGHCWVPFLAALSSQSAWSQSRSRPRPSPHTDPTWSVFLCESCTVTYGP